MKTFPMFLKLAGRPVVIVGDGEQAAQKCRLVLKTEGMIRLVSDAPDAELAAMVAEGRIAQVAPTCEAPFKDTALVFIATGCPGADAAWHGIAKDAGAVVNVVDAPDLCDAYTPSIVDRDPVVVAIGTEGTAPVLGRQIKTAIEGMLEPSLGELAAHAGRLRGRVAAKVPQHQRRAFWRWVFGGAPRTQAKAGQMRAALAEIKAAVEAGGAPEADGGLVTLVAAPDAADLLTLRAVARLQEADVIFHLAPSDGVLELARRDAERVFLGQRDGVASLPPSRIGGVVMQAARDGKRVVLLGGGAATEFGFSETEIAQLATTGIPFEQVPGQPPADAPRTRDRQVN